MPAARPDAPAYAFTRLSLGLILQDMRFADSDPGPGDRLPRAEVERATGGRMVLPDPDATRPMLLVFGSSTCPVTDNAAPGLRTLHARFGEAVSFLFVNVREAHPGLAFPQPRTPERKRLHAARLQALHHFPFDVVVDDVTGSLHRALGPKPNSAYLVAPDGTILFRAHWANATTALAAALEAVVAGRVPSPATSGGTLGASLRMLPDIAPVLDRAGPGAWADLWRIAPPLAAVARLFKALGIRPGASRR